jgi:DNA-binding NarL/FixJ family response regulator
MADQSSLATVLATRPSACARTRIRVLVAERHQLVRREIQGILQGDPEIAVVAEGSDGRVTLAAARRVRPHVVILDGTFPDLDGATATREFGRTVADVRVLLVGRDADPETVRTGLRAGAAGYLLKDALDVELIAAVKAVAAGGRFLSAAVERLVVENCVRPATSRGDPDAFSRLTGREREILQLIAEGRTRSDIGHVLALSPSTVDTHRQSMMAKLDLHNVAQLVRFAIRRKLVR